MLQIQKQHDTSALYCSQIGRSCNDCSLSTLVMHRLKCPPRLSGAPNPLAHCDMKMPGHC
jgi:hypothetical protein